MDPLHTSTVVLDHGSGTLRAGFGGSEKPSLIMPSVVGRPKLSDMRESASPSNSAPAGGSQGETIFFGEDVLTNSDALRRSYPVVWGLVQNWDDLTDMWKHVFQQKLACQMEETPLVVMESAYMVPKLNREKTTEIAFETFAVPRFCLARAPSALLRAMGDGTGLVIDLGRDNVRVVPVYENYCLPHAIMKFETGGQFVTDSLQRLLSQKGVSAVPDLKELTAVKEKLAYVAQDYEEEKKTFSTSQERSYTLLSGDVLTLGQEQFQCVECLFQPALIGMEMMGLAEHVVLTIFKCHADIRQSLLRNVLLVGGGSKLPGIDSRLQHDVEKQLRDHESPELRGLKVDVLAAPEGDLVVWKGGSGLVGTPQFAELCITKDDYDEHGPTIVHRKCIF